MSTQTLYFITDDSGSHLMTAPLPTLEAVFGLTAQHVMRLLSETAELGKECRIVQSGRRLMDKTIRVRRLPIEIPRQAE